MDLPERFLVKIKSRIGESRLVYQPYNERQIKKIIKSRIGDCRYIFDKNAIKIVAKKVSSLSGDIRRALQICKRATEMAKSEHAKVIREKGNEANETQITATHILKAFIELYNSENMLLLKALRKYE